jgi:hypothetical protein
MMAMMMNAIALAHKNLLHGQVWLNCRLLVYNLSAFSDAGKPLC